MDCTKRITVKEFAEGCPYEVVILSDLETYEEYIYSDLGQLVSDFGSYVILDMDYDVDGDALLTVSLCEGVVA